MKHPIKILHIFGQMQRGGAEMRTLDVMRNIEREKYKMDFCSLSGLRGVLDNDIAMLGGKIHLIPLGKNFEVNFRTLLEREKYDVVHSHIHYPSGYILRIAKKAGVPKRITHFRITNDGAMKGVFRNARNVLLKKWINKYSTHILAVCRGAMEEAWGANWRSDARCKIVYNGIDDQNFRYSDSPKTVRYEFGFPEQSKLYIHVGNLHQAKNHQKLLSIFSKICAEDEKARLLLVGRSGNAFSHDIHNQANQLAISDKVVFAGVREDIHRLFKAADIMIFPSYREGLPGAVLEASAAGVPVLGSDIPGICEIAEFVPAVTPFPLHESDMAWAKKSQTILHDFNLLIHREEIIKTFNNSPFTIYSAVNNLKKVWDSDSNEN